MEVFSGEWSRTCCERLNEHEAYRKAAATWEGTIILRMRADPSAGVEADRAVFFDLHHGACRGTREATEEDLDSADYVLAGPPNHWKQVVQGGLEPVAALMMGKLERGSLLALAKHVAAARELVAVSSSVGGTFPGSEP